MRKDQSGASMQTAGTKVVWFAKSNPAFYPVVLYCIFSIACIFMKTIIFWEIVSTILWLMMLYLWKFDYLKISSEEHTEAIKMIDHLLGDSITSEIEDVTAETYRPIQSRIKSKPKKLKSKNTEAKK